MNTLDQRYHELRGWLNCASVAPILDVVPMTGDASFRRFFRVNLPDETLVAIDAPPERESSHSFIAIAKLFRQAGLQVPEIFAFDLDRGFFLVTDLGDDLYSSELTPDNADELYAHALRDLLLIQTCRPNWRLPVLDRDRMLFELNHFLHWYLCVHLKLKLSAAERDCWAHLFNVLIDSALQQPQVCAHRDYHSRNLLCLPDGRVGIVDFQDALWAPVTYDLVSLIRDCYIDWPSSRVENWAKNYYQQALKQNIFSDVDWAQFLKWFDWMGVKRHLKAMGTFACKCHRDDCGDYLGNIPRALGYVMSVAQCYKEFNELHQFLQHRAFP